MANKNENKTNNSNEEQKMQPKNTKIDDATAKLIAIGKAAIKRTPALKAVYVTADGSCFDSNNNATNHGNTLTDKRVVEVK